MTVPGNRSNAKVLRPERCVVSDGKPCAACTEDVKLEQEIRELEKTIEELHNRRRALRTVMNENHDHLIHKFPPEIASHIFIKYAPPSASHHKKDRSTPLRLGSVCRKWRQLAWATPQLWSSVVIGPAKAPLELLAEWLERSASLPLTITFYGRSGQNDGVSQILNKHSARWYDIHLNVAPTCFPRFDGSSEGNILHRLILDSPIYITPSDPPKFSMKSQPCPTDLTLLRVGLPSVDIIWNNLTVASVDGIGVHDCVELIRRAPVLQTLRLRAIKTSPSIFPLPNTRIVHPHIRSLETSIFRNPSTFAAFLDSVAFPSLEQWTHNYPPFLMENFISFIEWSPHLKMFKLNINNAPADRVIQLLRHLPSLEFLELCQEPLMHGGVITIELIDMLVCASSESPRFLPCLQSLKFVSKTVFPWESLPQIFALPRWRSLRVKVSAPLGGNGHAAKLLWGLVKGGFELSINGDGEIDTPPEDLWYY